MFPTNHLKQHGCSVESLHCIYNDFAEILLTHNDLPLLERLLQNLAPRWKQAGSVLGVGQDILNKIERENLGTIASFSRVIILWLSQGDKPATVGSLMTALDRLQAYDIAQRVKCMYTTLSSE